MTALPPPKPDWDYLWLGVEIGAIYGIATAVALGSFLPVVAYIALGALIGAISGFICDQRPTY